MPKVVLYHNSRCSKSRQTLALIREQGIEPTIIDYLKQPPNAAEIALLLKKLRMKARDLIRSKESLFSELGLALEADEQDLIQAMSDHPVLIERPIVVCAAKACLGRPPEQVLELLS